MGGAWSPEAWFRASIPDPVAGFGGGIDQPGCGTHLLWSRYDWQASGHLPERIFEADHYIRLV